MVQLSEKAIEMLNDFFKRKNKVSPIRIFLQEGG
jgi:Fe-S cluster assembly iron-binding protein IscA